MIRIAIALALSISAGGGIAGLLAMMTPDRSLVFGILGVLVVLVALLAFIIWQIDRSVEADFLEDEKHWGGR